MSIGADSGGASDGKHAPSSREVPELTLTTLPPAVRDALMKTYVLDNGALERHEQALRNTHGVADEHNSDASSDSSSTHDGEQGKGKHENEHGDLSSEQQAQRSAFSRFEDYVGLFADEAPEELAPSTQPSGRPVVKFVESGVIWGTNDYYPDEIANGDVRDVSDEKDQMPERSQHGSYAYDFFAPANDFGIIKSRWEKTHEDQRRRAKKKAEVFTPAWTVNAQVNLLDNHTLYENAFNAEMTLEDGSHTWIPSLSPIDFSKSSWDRLNSAKSNHAWLRFVTDPRIEMCCGEGPYLATRYDAATGFPIPLTDERGAFRRVGVLDRKFRVIIESLMNPENKEFNRGKTFKALAEMKEDWVWLAHVALRSTYGFEWQGDSLLLARLNMLNTYLDYERHFFELAGIPYGSRGIGDDFHERMLAAAEIISWNTWQMDGLKQVVPLTCSDACLSCKKRTLKGHDGVHPVIRWGKEYRVFEDMIGNHSDASPTKDKRKK